MSSSGKSATPYLVTIVTPLGVTYSIFKDDQDFEQLHDDLTGLHARIQPSPWKLPEFSKRRGFAGFKLGVKGKWMRKTEVYLNKLGVVDFWVKSPPMQCLLRLRGK